MEREITAAEDNLLCMTGSRTPRPVARVFLRSIGLLVNEMQPRRRKDAEIKARRNHLVIPPRLSQRLRDSAVAF